MNGVTLYGFGFGKSGRALEVALVEEGGALLALERQDVRGHPVQEVPARPSLINFIEKEFQSKSSWQ